MGTLHFCCIAGTVQDTELFGEVVDSMIDVPGRQTFSIRPTAEPEYHFNDGECWQKVSGTLTIPHANVWRKVMP